MRIISREKFSELIHLVRNVVEREIDFDEYFEEDSSKANELEADFQGVSNGFLSEIISVIIGCEVEVIGQVEDLLPCPCCGLRTLTELYDELEGTGYDICSYCKWEDDGTKDINSYRSINQGSILDYRKKLLINFNKYYIKKWIE